LLPDCPSFILTDGVDLVKYDSLKSFFWDIRTTGEGSFQKTYRLIRGFHVLAKGGERSMIASISGTVTTI
jgi:hypothetical protein